MNHVQICSPEEAAALIARMQAPKAAAPFFTLKGWVDLVCREANGAVAWEVHQPNLITDEGRKAYANGWWGTVHLATSPCSEVALIGRSSLLDDGTSASSQATTGAVTPTKDAITNTRSYNTTFAAPAANRTIGAVLLTPGAAVSSNYGLVGIFAYTVLSPIRIQTTTSTLEITYKVTLTPTY